MKNRRLLGYLALAAVLLLAGIVAVAAFESLQVPFQPPSAITATPALDCSPAPCADVRGYTLWVASITTQGDLVSMQVTYKNSSDATHASPEDLQLIDSRQHTSGPVFDAPDCTQWSRHEFSNGATYGPITMCFRIAGVTPPLVLRWSPDLGFFCCRTDIMLG